MKMKILQLPNPLLREKSAEIQEVNDEIRKILDDMLETMYHSRGVGLAAPQVGLLQRMVVIDIAGKDEKPLCGLDGEAVNIIIQPLQRCAGVSFVCRIWYSEDGATRYGRRFPHSRG